MDVSLSDYIKDDEKSLCLSNCVTTHTIMRDKIYFSHLTSKVNTISSASDLIEGFRRAHINLVFYTINLSLMIQYFQPNRKETF